MANDGAGKRVLQWRCVSTGAAKAYMLRYGRRARFESMTARLETLRVRNGPRWVLLRGP